jgi:NitT/TauT family transport system substrate-binding protein
VAPIVLSENFRAVFYAPFYAAVAIGAYAAEGVTVELRASPSPEATAQALRSGAADVMWGGPLRVLLSREATPDLPDDERITCFCGAVGRDPFFIIGRTPRPGFKVTHLAGVRLATVSEVPTPWLCLQQDLRDANIDPQSVVRMTGGTMAENADALRRDEIDAVQLFQPYAEALLREGAGHLWYAAATRGPTAYTALIAQRGKLRTRRPELSAMVRGMARTLDWIAASEGPRVAAALAPWFPDTPPALLAACIDRYRALGLWDRSPVMEPAGFERLRASMRSGGALAHGAAFEDCVDTALAREALAA